MGARTDGSETKPSDVAPFPSLSAALDSPEAEERRQATSELARAPLDEALPLLLRALGDADWRVRKEATIVARTFGAAPALIAELLGVFAHAEDVGLRNAAVEVLANVGAPATAALAAALPGLDPDGRKLAVETLGRSSDPRAITALAAALDDRDPNVRSSAIEAIAALGRLSPERVAEVLLAHLDDRDVLVRLAAVEGLTALDVPIPWVRLAPLLEQPALRAAALAAASLGDAPDAAHAIADLLIRAGSQPGARSTFDQALHALGRLADGPMGPNIALTLRAAGPALGARLVEAALAGHGAGRAGGGEDLTARRGMALRLAALMDAPGVADAAIAALTEDLLADGAQRVLVDAGLAGLPHLFARLVDPSLSSDARAALVDVVADVLDRGVEGDPSALGAATDATDATFAPAHAALRVAAREGDRPVAVRALRALARLGRPEDLALAAERTLATDRPIAAAAEGALVALASRFPDAGRALATSFGRDPATELPAAILIGVVGAITEGDRDAAFLAHAATAGDPRARRAAVEAVSALRARAGDSYPAALEVLGFALTDEEHEVQLAAARALGRLCSSPSSPRASEVLDLVNRSGAADLVAATVRAMGEGIRGGVGPSTELVAALALFARGAPSQVALAAVDALALAQRAYAPSGEGAEAGVSLPVSALAGALDHPDEDVVKAALLKLAAGSRHDTHVLVAALVKGLSHPSAAVRALAAEALGERDGDDARAALERRLALESDRRVEEILRRMLSASRAGHDEGGG